MINIKIHSDFSWLAKVSSASQRKIITDMAAKPKLLGRLNCALLHPQAARWKKDPVPLKMTTMYLVADELLMDAGIPEELLKIAVAGVGNIAGKPLTHELKKSIRFISIAWHLRAARIYRLLLKEFKSGKYVASYGCGSGMIEIFALIASGNKDARVDLMDRDPIGIELAKKLIELFYEHGYDIRSQVTMSVDDIFTIEPSDKVDTILSAGLLHNYFPLKTANALVKKWLNVGIKKIITDIFYDPAKVDDGKNDAKIRAKFVNRVLNWKFGPPDGLLYCSKEALCESLSTYNIELYDQSLNATLVVTAQ